MQGRERGTFCLLGLLPSSSAHFLLHLCAFLHFFIPLFFSSLLPIRFVHFWFLSHIIFVLQSGWTYSLPSISLCLWLLHSFINFSHDIEWNQLFEFQSKSAPFPFSTQYTAFIFHCPFAVNFIYWLVDFSAVWIDSAWDLRPASGRYTSTNWSDRCLSRTLFLSSKTRIFSRLRSVRQGFFVVVKFIKYSIMMMIWVVWGIRKG